MAFPTPAEIPNTTLPLPDPAAYPDEPREYARALMQRKEEIEREISALRDVLQSHGSDMTSSLIDPEGYPRGDIDIYAIRHARAALARLNTDRAAVTNLLPAALEAAFARPAYATSPATTSTSQPNGDQAAPNGAASSPAAPPAPTSVIDPDVSWPALPVARVDSVENGSPAAEAGLMDGDLIYIFEGITRQQGMRAIGTVVQMAGSSPLRIFVMRGPDKHVLRLTPRANWGGRGSLGCHIVPP